MSALECTQPPALVIRVELEGPPRFTLVCRSASEEGRLRYDVGANLEQLLARVQAELESFAGRAADLSLSAIAAAGATIVKGEKTVADVVIAAACDDKRACEWLAWAMRNLGESDERLGAIQLFVSALAPDLWAELRAEREVLLQRGSEDGGRPRPSPADLEFALACARPGCFWRGRPAEFPRHVCPTAAPASREEIEAWLAEHGSYTEQGIPQDEATARLDARLIALDDESEPREGGL